MATVTLFIDPKPGSVADFQRIGRKFKFTRVPSEGEFVDMGQDKNGSALDYEVVLVHHTPLKPGGIDAEVYMKRVELPQEIKQRSPRSKRKK